MTEYSYSSDNEVFQGSYASREEARDAGFASLGTPWADEVIWTGEKLNPPHAKSMVPRAADFLEQLGEQACDEYGEVAEDWPNLAADEEAWLEGRLNEIAAFLQRVDPPAFHLVGHIQSHPSPTAAAVEDA